MSDITDGKIYRVNVATEVVELIYDHPYGINTIYRDKTGALWFSQSLQKVLTKQKCFYNMQIYRYPMVRCIEWQI
ncbi:MAG: hypothetical protein R2728_04150 [Chitinophagales bacterium]